MSMKTTLSVALKDRSSSMESHGPQWWLTGKTLRWTSGGNKCLLNNEEYACTSVHHGGTQGQQWALRSPQLGSMSQRDAFRP